MAKPVKLTEHLETALNQVLDELNTVKNVTELTAEELLEFKNLAETMHGYALANRILRYIATVSDNNEYERMKYRKTYERLEYIREALDTHRNVDILCQEFAEKYGMRLGSARTIIYKLMKDNNLGGFK